MTYSFARVLKFAVAIVFATLIVGSGWLKLRRSDGNRIVSLCEISRQGLGFEGETVIVEGQLQGFHYLVVTNKECSPPAALLVDLDRQTRGDLFRRLESRRQRYLVNGNLDMPVRLAGSIRSLNRADQSDHCYAPNYQVVDSRINGCLVVGSIEKIELLWDE